MLPLENQVCTPNQSEQFELLGIKVAKSYFIWVKYGVSDKWNLEHREYLTENELWKCLHSFSPAYSLAELWEFLTIILNSINNDQRRMDTLNGIFASMRDYDKPATHVLADRIIFALEQKIIQPEDLKL